MPERRKRLTEKLNEVDGHLEAETVAAELAEPLQEAIGALRTVVDAAEDDPENDEELAETFGDMALEFEVSHPKLTQVLNQISELLAGSGF